MYETLNRATGGLLDRMMQKPFLRYLVFISFGAMGYLILIGATYALTTFLGLWRVYSYGIGLACAITFLFPFHRHITFNNTTLPKERFARFTAVELSVAFGNFLLFSFLTELLPMQYPAAALLSAYYPVTSFFVTLLLSILNFTANRLWVFAHE